MFIVFRVEMPDDEWMKSLDKEALAKLLPPKKPDVPASTVTDAKYVATELADFGSDDDWEDDGDDDDDEEEGPECQHQ